MTATLRRLGARLAFLALAAQVALPLLVAVEIRALAAAEPLSPIAGASLCLHDGTTAPAAPAQPSNCGASACPLCVALAASLALIVPAAPGLIPPRGEAAAPRPATAPAAFGAVFISYRSRAPPPLG